MLSSQLCVQNGSFMVNNVYNQHKTTSLNNRTSFVFIRSVVRLTATHWDLFCWLLHSHLQIFVRWCSKHVISGSLFHDANHILAFLTVFQYTLYINSLPNFNRLNKWQHQLALNIKSVELVSRLIYSSSITRSNIREKNEMKNEMGGACGTYGGGERSAQGSGEETWGKETTGETIDVDGRIILRWIFRKWEGFMETGWSCLRIGAGGGNLWVQWGTFGFQKCGQFLD